MGIQRSISIENSDKHLKIYTLGKFNVLLNDKIINDNPKRSSKIWDIFKYIITNRKKRISCDNFIDILWPEEDCSNPLKALHTLVYRLRLQIEDPCKSKSGESNIYFSQGGYYWNPNADYWLDAEEFEKLYKEAVQADKINNPEAIYLYKRAFSLYQGEYLPECSYSVWVVPIRNYYRRIYLEMTLKFINLLKKNKRYREVLETCEAALQIEPYEESLHYCFMEALIDQKKAKQALDHYEYITSVFYNEMGIKPSNSLRCLYKKIQSSTENFELPIHFELDKIQEMMIDRTVHDGAYLCDFEHFQSVYNLEMRRLNRNGQKVFLVLFTCNIHKIYNEFKLPGDIIDLLEERLILNLRKGDVISRVNESQFICMLSGINIEHVEKVVGRIVKKLISTASLKSVVIKTNIQAIFPTEMCIVNKTS